MSKQLWTEKGQAIGYCIGKYGVDIFAGGATFKCVSAVKKLKNANRVCNLEALAASETNREVITSAALKHAADKECFLSNVKIQWDKQNKHVVGKHNYEIGRSLFEHKDAQELLSRFAGTGKSVNGQSIGTVGYRERVDFGEFIGYYIPKNDPSLKLPTTKGVIHYSNKGAHIIPCSPDGV